MKPFVKWVGGKTQLLDRIKERMPESFNNYVEPFIGGGALFLSMKNLENATINDFNSQLINCYKQIKENLNSLISELDRLTNEFNNSSDKANYYYEARKAYNNELDNLDSIINAARFIFLNKACFNGLYRINLKGQFNSPFGKKEKVNLYDLENLKAISERLQKTNILNGDFSLACKNLKENDFVFFDSPYYDTFDTYQKGGFSEEDHLRLFKLFKELSDKGVKCMLTNSNTDFIKELYKDYKVEVVEVKRMINRNGNSRTGQEVIITNY